MKKPIKVFGVALDPNDNKSKLLIKYAYVQALRENRIKEPNYQDPFHYFIKKSRSLNDERFIKIGKFPVESWLTPKPNILDLDLINPIDYQIFLESGGCLEYRKEIEKFLNENINDEIPLMIAADHSTTGAMISFLSRKFGNNDLTCIVLDGHFDGISSNTRIGLAKYAADKKLETSNFLLNPEDLKKLNVIKEYYNCGTFLKYILNDNIIKPQNLIVIGCNDYPNEEMKKVNDERVKKYVQEFQFFEDLGVKIIPKMSDFQIFKETLQEKLETISTSKIFISTDVDVGAGKAVLAARFIDAFGLNHEEIIIIYKMISDFMKNNSIELIGADFTEIETQFIGKILKDGTKDLTLEIFDEFLDIFF
ncbi:MAG: arginase family protein [Candidatus Helarchaeota archaeon]